MQTNDLKELSPLEKVTLPTAAMPVLKCHPFSRRPGNGFNMALRSHFPDELYGWDSRNPLHWKEQGYWSRLDDQFKEISGATDYERIENAVRSGDHNMRRYVCNRLLSSFAAYHHAIQLLPFELWPWFTWFKRSAKHLDFVVSLNYDLLLETLLKRIDHSYHRMGIFGENGETLIFKPHGSLDYGFPEDALKDLVEWSEATRTPLSEMECSHYEALPPERLGESRYSCDVVLPTDYNRIQHYQVISRGYTEICQRVANLTHVIVVGVSYWECDRPELDRLLDQVPSAASIIMVNPHPSREWSDRLQRQGRRVTFCKSPEMIPGK
jgi:hypothetical protein